MSGKNIEFPHLEITRTFYDSDCDSTGRVSVARIIDLLQGSATAHADILGVGMSELMKDGYTWMLSSMSVSFDKWPQIMEPIKLTTWPAGSKKNLICHRDYIIEDKNEPLIRSTSDWIYVDINNRKIARLPTRLATLAPEGVPRVDIEKGERSSSNGDFTKSIEITIRRADIDINRHVNNVHYIEWLFEPLSDEEFSHSLKRLDIIYKAEARLGDKIESCLKIDNTSKTIHHLLRRVSDRLPLVAATSVWE